MESIWQILSSKRNRVKHSKLDFVNRTSFVRWRSRTTFAGLLLVTLVGCGDGRRERVPVSGQVLIDGKPLTRGDILFAPLEGRSSRGRLDQEGRFTLTCYDDGDGAVIGTHQVAITSGEGVSPTKTRWFAPKKLAKVQTSGLTQEITGPVDNLVINISWEGGREYVEVIGGGASEEPALPTPVGKRPAQ